MPPDRFAITGGLGETGAGQFTPIFNMAKTSKSRSTAIAAAVLAVGAIALPILISAAHYLTVPLRTPPTVVKTASSPMVSPAAKPTPKPRKWFSGGTLHKATQKQWNAGADADRLATCADFIFASRNSFKPEIKAKLERMDEVTLKTMATQLRAGIDDVMSVDAEIGDTAPEIAALGMAGSDWVR